ncbi:MAG: ferrous iron transport protein B [Thermoanaerobaculia bacterium]
MSQLALARSRSSTDVPKLLLVGNPNVGKSLLFTRLTNRYVTVSNYAGTTVEITTATAEFDGQLREVVDTPGANGLTPQSADERVTRDLLLEYPDDVVQVADISNLRRALLLSLQLAEHEVAFTVCLNMSDEAKQPVDTAALSAAIGVPVVATSALRRWNVERLRAEAVRPRRSTLRANYGEEIESAVRKIGGNRGVALSSLADDQAVSATIAAARMAAVDRIVAEHATHRGVGGFRGWLGAITMHPVWGLPCLAAVLCFAWLFVGKFGAGILVDFFENTIFERFINPLTTRLVTFLFGSVPFVRDLLVGEYGLITMALTYSIAIVLPVVITFFTFFGLLEDSGYLPRLAVMLHRTFRRMGLNGKAVLPMVLGLGCDTMATLTTRILDTRKQAVIVTLLLALGVPCSAQLGVIMALLGPLGVAAVAVWIGITIGTIFVVGWLAARVVPGESGEFILEVPPVRLPKLSNILIKVLARTEWYLKEAVPLFMAGTLLLFLLDAAHLLTRLQRLLAPVVVGALGLPAQASNAFVVGFLRRDYGAAGLYAMQRAGQLTPNQTVVALTVMTLFIPCIANFFVIVRERGAKAGAAIAAFIVVYAVGIGAALNAALNVFGVTLG